MAAAVAFLVAAVFALHRRLVVLVVLESSNILCGVQVLCMKGGWSILVTGECLRGRDGGGGGQRGQITKEDMTTRWQRANNTIVTSRSQNPLSVLI